MAGRTAAAKASASTAASSGGLDAADAALQAAITPVVAAGGCVLLPCDVIGRALELLLRLDAWWDPAVHGDLFFLTTSAVGESADKVGESILELAK